MLKTTKKVAVLLLMLFITQGLRAQMSGTYNVPSNFSTLAAAISSLNAVGISGPVTINVPAGYTEAITAGYSLTATGTAANPIIFQKSGAGANPLITAYAGTSTPATAMQDGIWSLIGSDYVTIDGIDLSDPNTTNPATMEYGYGLFKASATDGCNNNTIKNCVITLNRVNNVAGTAPALDGSRGINLVASTMGAQTTALTITSAAGASSNNKFYSNTIQNCNIGMALIGFAAASPFTLADTGNDIGGSGATTGNSILNFGGGAAPVGTAYGIRTLAQYNLNASYNTINNNNGSGVNHVQALRGISAGAATSANATINNNTLTLQGGGTTQLVAVIENAAGSTAASNSITIANNVINNCTYNTSTTGVFNAILNSGTAATLTIGANLVSNISLAGTAVNVLVETGSAAVSVISSNTITGVTLSGASGNCRVLKTTSPATSFAANNNLIDGVSYTSVGSTGNIDGVFSNNGATAVTINNNIIRNLFLPGSGTINGIKQTDGAGGAKMIQGNEIYNFATSSGGAGGATFNGIWSDNGATIDISGNKIYALTHSGTAGGTINGLQIAGGTTDRIYKNRIYNLSATGTSATLIGMLISGSTTSNIFNNLISDINATAANGANPVIGISLTGAANNNIYFNTIYLTAASSGTLFGSSAISVNATPTNIGLRNNIFVNASAQAGTGITAAFRKSSTSLTNYAATSNNNLFYAGVPTASNVIFYNGTNTYSTIALYKTFMSTRDGVSVTENPPFISTVGGNANFLNINASIATQIESGGAAIGTYTDDYAGNPRAATPDIGAWEGTYTINDITAPTISGIAFITPACNTTSRSFTATITDASGVSSGVTAPRAYYSLNGGAYTSVAGTLSSGTALNGVWTFSLAFTANASDVISYYVVAQDIAPTPNVAALPAAGFTGTDVNTITTPPTTPSTFAVAGTLNGLYTVGAAGTFTSLTAAANAYNTYCVTGPVTFELSNALYAASTGETFPIVFQNITYASATNSLLIKPAAGVAAVVTGTASSVIKFLNARYITVDGLNAGGSSLTINNTSTGTSAVVWLASTATTGPGNTTIAVKNCALNGGNNLAGSYGIISAVNGTNPAATAGLDNDNITVSSNTIINVYYGIYVRGTAATSTGGADSWLINNNIVGPATQGATSTGGSGILLQNVLTTTVSGNLVRNLNTADITMSAIFLKTNVNGAVVSQNTITNISSSASGSDVDAIAGVYMGAGVVSSTISANRISSIENTSSSGFGARGIIVNTGATASVTIVNNMIADVISYSDSDYLYWPVGIALEGSAGGITIDHNSISLSGSHTGLTGATGSAPLLLNSTGTLILRNNILSNTYNNTTSTSDVVYAVYSENSSTSFSTADYNDYYVGGTGNTPVLGSLNFTDFLTLAAFQTGFTGNLNSKTLAPVFTSVTDLHLPSVGNALLDNLGTPLAGVTVDIDNQARSLTTPDMGADEFSGPSCTTASGGTVTASSATGCSGQALTFNAAGTSTGATTSYQWQVSPVAGGSYTNVTGGTGAATPSYTNAALPTGTYYFVLKTTCASATLTGISNEVTVTINAAPTASASASPTLVCAGSNVSLAGASDFGSTYSWTGPNSFTSAAQNPVVTAATTSASGVYTLVVSAGTCSTTTTLPVTIGGAVSPLTVTPASASICSGKSQTLSVAGGAPAYQLNVGTQAAQNTAGVNAATDYPAPYTLYWGGQKMQILILASELSSAGFSAGSQLTNVQFPVVSRGADWPTTTTSLLNFRVSMGHTNLTALTSFQTGLTVVKAAGSFTPAVGYANTHNFSTAAFTWNGTSNVILETTFSNNTVGTASSAIVQYNSPTSFQSTVVYRDDSQSANTVANATTVNYAYSSRPDFRLNGLSFGTYSWTPATGLSGTTGTLVTATPTVSQTYTVTYSNGCTTSTNVAVTVMPSPTLSIASPTSVCVGNSVTLTASGASSYTWNTTPTPTTDIVVSPTANTGYTVTAAVGSCTASLSRTIVANASPTVGSAITSTLVCSGTPVTVTGSGATSYTVSGGITSGTPFVASATTNYTVTGSNAAGCTGTSVKSLSVNATPTISFSGSSGICTGQTASVIASGADTYSWATGETTNSIVVSPPATTVYTVTGINTVGGCSATVTQPVTVSNVLAVVISGPTVACEGQPALLTASGGLTYTWSTGATTSTIAPASTINNTSYTVTGASGTCSNTAVATISINLNPTVTISGPTAACAGQSIALTGNGAATYTWNTAATTQSIGVTPVANTSYTVTGKSAQGCTATAVTAITSNTLPVITIAQTSTAVCAGSPATLTASGASTYTWASGPTAPVNVVSPTANTTYTVSGASTVGCISSKTAAMVSNSLPVVVILPASPTICASSVTNLVASGGSTYTWTSGPSTANYTVNPSATTSYTVTGANAAGCSAVQIVTVVTNAVPVVAVAQSASSVCANSPVSFTASGANTYTWNNGATTPVLTVNPFGTSSYTVTGKNVQNCTAVAIVTVNTLALPVIAITPASGSVCVNTPVSYTASGALTYTWVNSASNSSVAVFSAAGISSFSVSGTGTNGCTGSAHNNVSVYQLPVIAVSAFSQTICALAPVTFTATGADTYSWNTGATTDAVTVNPASSADVYTVTGTSAVTGCSGSETISVIANPLPAVAITPASTVVCQNSSLLLTASGADSYQWLNNSSANAGINVTPLVSTTYSVTGTDLLGCSKTETVLVTVNPLPTISVAPASPTICMSLATTFTASGAGNYSWTPGAASTDTFAATLTVSTVFTVTGTDANNCEGRAIFGVEVTECVGIRSNSFPDNSVSLYPNPSNGIITAAFDFEGTKTITVSNAVGQLIAELNTNNTSETIDLSGMAKGVYFVKVSTKTASGNYKIIIE